MNESDVLDGVLRSWQPQGQIFCHLELTGPWAFRMVGSGLARFHVVERGTCWLQTRANESPIELSPGDLVVALHGHRLSHNARPRNVNSLQTFLERLQHFSPIGFRKPGTGAGTHLLCGSFQLMHGVRHPLLTALPSVLHVKGHHGKPVDWLDNTLKLLRAEIAAGGVGSETIISRLTDLIFIQAVRAWIGQQPQDLVARLGALRDRHIGAALRLMHREPGRAWTVPSLARAVGLSRATLARPEPTYPMWTRLRGSMRCMSYHSTFWRSEDRQLIDTDSVRRDALQRLARECTVMSEVLELTPRRPLFGQEELGCQNDDSSFLEKLRSKGSDAWHKVLGRSVALGYERASPIVDRMSIPMR